MFKERIVKYVVKKPFYCDGAMKKPGDSIELDRKRANSLLQYGFLGRPIETAKKEPGERAVKPKPTNKKKDKKYISPHQYPEKE